MNSKVLITKASGEKEFFNVSKLERSLKNAGTSSETAEKIISAVNDRITPGVSSKQIYRMAYSLLRKDKSSQSVKYKLKQAFFELGSSGYPFEKIIGELFHRRGYTCEVGVKVQGKCITHEMDVIATKGPTQHLMECKYRLDQGKSISIQVPLYVHSRVNDIINYRRVLPENKGVHYEGWVVTNTRFSTDSELYSNCYGINLLSWDYPAGNGLKDLVEQHSLFPISILVGLTRKEKQTLFDKGIVTCRQLKENSRELNQFQLSKVKVKRILRELDELCS